MANLLRRALAGAGQPGERAIGAGTVDDYLATVNSMPGFGGGVEQTLAGGSAERISANLEGLATQVYGRNSVIFACMLVRQLVFAGVRFQYQRLNQGRPSELFGTPELGLLEQPWEGGTTGDLLARMITDADLAGNSYWTAYGNELVRLRPDWVDIVLESRVVGRGANDTLQVMGSRRIGYLYYEGGQRHLADPVALTTRDVAHFAPLPDPLSTYRGMSWLSPLMREVTGDDLMTRHKQKFFEHGASPNMIIKHAPTVTPKQAREFKAALDEEYSGVDNAYRTMHLGGGADATVVGSNFEQIDFQVVQSHGETRIAAAAGVPAIIVGLSKGLESATYCGTYDEAVWTTRGIVKLGEIAPGDAVWSFVEDRIEPRKVVWHERTGTKPVYTVRTKNRTIRFTDNHPVLVRVPGNSRGGNAERAPRVEWRRVDELAVGDRVVQAQRLPDQGGARLPNGQPATADVLRWLGAYTGDGCLDGADGVRMCIPTQDRTRDDYAALAGRLFTKQTSWRRPNRGATDGLTPEMVRLRGEGLTYPAIVERMGLTLNPASVRDRIQTATREFVPPTAPVTLRETRNGFGFSSRTAAQWHHDMGVTGYAATKRVPGWVFELSEDLRLAYLAGVVDTDGSVGSDGRLAIQFAGHALVEDVRMLLISCGIACSNIAEVEYRADVLPNRGTHPTYQAWRFVASSALEVARIPFVDARYRERVRANEHRHRPGGLDAHKAGLHEDLGFYTIRSIEVGPPEPVYDIEVDEGHSFLVDGVVVHNSNYGQARRRFADATLHPLWANAAGSLQRIRPAPPGARLFYDTRDVPFLREDSKDAADIASVQAQTMRTLIDGGYTPDSVSRAVMSGDFGLLVHSGLLSVQLQSPGAQAPPTPSTPPARTQPAADGPREATMSDQDETAEVLGSQAYRDAYSAVMTGTELAMLPDEQREVVRRAREATGTPAPGLPMPLDMDPTRRPDRGGDGG